MRGPGYAIVDAAGLAHVAHVTLDALDALHVGWDELPADEHLRDGGRYRKRRHGCFTVDHSVVAAVAHRAHWQPVEYNALHGGLLRWFQPIDERLTSSPAWSSLLVGLAALASALKGTQRWFVEAHQFRIDTSDGIGRPTPEGAHRDGVDLVAVVLVERHAIRGGETRVFAADGPQGIRFTLAQPWSALILDDERVVHESTPIQPVDHGGHRDTLVVTLRRGAFQGP